MPGTSAAFLAFGSGALSVITPRTAERRKGPEDFPRNEEQVTADDISTKSDAPAKTPWWRGGGLKAGIALLVLLGLFLAFQFLPLQSWVERFLSWVSELGFWGPLVLGLTYVVATVFMFPGSILTLGAGALFGLFLGTVTVIIASNLGAALAFIIGRNIARGWVESKVSGNRRFRAIDRAVGRQGFKIVFLTRLSPVFPFNLQNYAYGLTGVSLGGYVLATVIGMLPGTILYVYLGSVARNLGEIFRGDVGGSLWLKIVGLIATIAVTVLVTRIARRALSEKLPEEGDVGESAPA